MIAGVMFPLHKPMNLGQSLLRSQGSPFKRLGQVCQYVAAWMSIKDPGFNK